MENNILSIEHDYTSDCHDPDYVPENEVTIDGSIDEIDELQNTDDNEHDSVEETRPIERINNRGRYVKIWGNYACTRRLLQLYNEFNPKIGRCGQFTKKNQMFDYIAEKLYEEFGIKYTGVQVASRSKKFFGGIRKMLKPAEPNGRKSAIDISDYNLETLYDDEDEEDAEVSFQKVSKSENDEHGNISKAEFTNQHSRKLIRLYNMFIPNLGSNNQFKTKKEVFQAISEELRHAFNANYTPAQCENRYKSIVRKARRLILRGQELKPKSKQKKNQKNYSFKDLNKESLIFETDHIRNTYSMSDDEKSSSYQNDYNENNIFVQQESITDDYNYDRKSPVYIKSEQTKSCNDGGTFKNSTSFDNKFLKFHDKDLMRQYLEYKERKMGEEQNRHNEIMQELRKINKTLLEIQCQSNVDDGS